MKEIVLTNQDAEDLRNALLSEIESSAILLASVAASVDGERLLVRELLIAEPGDYTSRGVIDAELAPAFVARATKRAKLENLSLIFAHSHPGEHAPHFSSTDSFGEARLAEFLAHRLPDMPHAAIVVSAGGWSARRLGSSEEVRVVSVGSEGRSALFEPDAGASATSAAKFDRQVRALGKDGQEAIASLRVGIVGLGGTGSIVAQQLAHLGVRDFILIDADTIEETNLNRVVTATTSDIGLPKTAIAARYIERFEPLARVRSVQGDITRTQTALHLRDVDFIFGCTDSHGSRAVLQQIAYQYLIPCIDVGSIITAADGTIANIFGRVQLLAPGQACFTCGNLLDADEIRRDMMNDFERTLDPYIVGSREPAPAVISLNGTVVSLAITMFMAVVTALPASGRHLIYNACSATLRSVRVMPKEGCYICSKHGSLARGDTQPLFARTG